MAVLKEQLLGARPRRCVRRLETLRHGGAQFPLAAGIGFRQYLEVGDDSLAVDERDSPVHGLVEVQHGFREIAEGSASVIGPASGLRCGDRYWKQAGKGLEPWM